MTRTARLLAVVSMFTLLTASLPLLAPGQARAHEGHAGPMINFLDEKAALKSMLPEGARITRRKQELNGEVYTFLLARDGREGPVTGAAMTGTVEVEHGDVHVAVGVDAHGNVSRAAVLSANRKYVPRVSAEVGKGVIDSLSGVSVAELGRRAAAAEGEIGQAVLSALRDMARTLVALTGAAGK